MEHIFVIGLGGTGGYLVHFLSSIGNLTVTAFENDFVSIENIKTSIYREVDVMLPKMACINRYIKDKLRFYGINRYTYEDEVKRAVDRGHFVFDCSDSVFSLFDNMVTSGIGYDRGEVRWNFDDGYVFNITSKPETTFGIGERVTYDMRPPAYLSALNAIFMILIWKEYPFLRGNYMFSVRDLVDFIRSKEVK